MSLQGRYKYLYGLQTDALADDSAKITGVNGVTMTDKVKGTLHDQYHFSNGSALSNGISDTNCIDIINNDIK